MRVNIETKFPCPAHKVCSEVLTTRLLLYVCSPLVRFTPIDPARFPSEWTDGSYLVAMHLFGFIPFGRQHIVISRPRPGYDDGTFLLRDNGYGDFIRRWDHLIRIQSAEHDSTIYSDTIDIDAGFLTPLVWLYAEIFYRWRQGRWRQLIRRQFNYGTNV